MNIKWKVNPKDIRAQDRMNLLEDLIIPGSILSEVWCINSAALPDFDGTFMTSADPSSKVKPIDEMQM